MEVARRRGKARARVAVARKLGVILQRMWRGGADFRFGKAPTAAAARHVAGRRSTEKTVTRLRPRDRDRSFGDDGHGDPVKSYDRGGLAPAVARQIGTPRPPNPIMRRSCADREEKGETQGRDDSRRTEKARTADEKSTEQLDPINPNQRGCS